MLKEFPAETVELLYVDIKRMAYMPIESERMEETDEYARDIVKQFDL